MNQFIPEVKAPVTNWPKSLVIAGQPKVGKSEIAARFTREFAKGESVILCVDEQAPYDQIAAASIQFNTPKEFETWLDKVINSGEKIKYGIVDHMTKLDDWAEKVATIEYMRSPQGKTFNREKGQVVDPNSTKWRSVHELPNGAG